MGSVCQVHAGFSAQRLAVTTASHSYVSVCVCVSQTYRPGSAACVCVKEHRAQFLHGLEWDTDGGKTDVNQCVMCVPRRVACVYTVCTCVPMWAYV